MTKSLIIELQEEHRRMLDILARVRDLGIATRAGREKLLDARDLLISHMRKEDENYYPELKRAAQTSGDLQRMMDYFVRDMEAVSTQAMKLFDKYAQGGDEGEFAGEIKLLYMTLQDRIRTEEDVLFGKFPGKAALEK